MTSPKLFEIPDRVGPLHLISNGSGQDSSAIIVRFALDKEARKQFNVTLKDLVIIGCDTGDEHDETYQQAEWLRAFCAERGIEYYFLTADMGYHAPAWRTLSTQYNRNHTVGSQKGFKRSCTQNLKLAPFYKFANEYVAKRFGFVVVDNKAALYAYAARHGIIPVHIGFTIEEDDRISGDNDPHQPAYMRACIRKTYPARVWGWTRQDCQDYLRSVGAPVPPPSQCVRCFWKSPLDLIWTKRLYPRQWDEWVAQEQAKLKKFEGRPGPNYGVFGKFTLEEVHAQALAHFGHLSDDELHAHRMNHGHCIKNRI